MPFKGLSWAWKEKMKKKSSSRGFTLIELMIVVAVLAILAAIVYPSYQQYMIRANRSAAQTFMLAASNKQEQFILDARQYATGDTAAAIAAALSMPAPESNIQDNYDISIAYRNDNPRTYLITATARPGTVQAGDGTLTLNERGEKTPAGKW